MTLKVKWRYADIKELSIFSFHPKGTPKEERHLNTYIYECHKILHHMWPLGACKET